MAFYHILKLNQFFVKETLNKIKEVYDKENYLTDPHGAVALVAAEKLRQKAGNLKTVCMETAHPSKFPDTIKKALCVNKLPESARHQSIETAKNLCQRGYTCNHAHLEEALLMAMNKNWDLTKVLKN